MLRTSDKVDGDAGRARRATAAVDHLYRGQSNDCYWHGLFGGIYISHMRLATLRAPDRRRGPRRRARPGALARRRAAATSTWTAATRSGSPTPGRSSRSTSTRAPGSAAGTSGAARHALTAGPAPPARGVPRDAARPRGAAGGGRRRTAGATRRDGGAGLDPRRRPGQGAGPRRPAPLRRLRAPLRARPLPRARTPRRTAGRPARPTELGDAVDGAFEVDRARARAGWSRRATAVAMRRRPAAVRVTKTIRLGGGRRSTRRSTWRVDVENIGPTGRSRRASASSGRLTMLGGGGNPSAWWEVAGDADRARRARARPRASTPFAQGNDYVGVAIATRVSRAGGRLVGAGRDGLELRERLRARLPGQRDCSCRGRWRLAARARARGTVADAVRHGCGRPTDPRPRPAERVSRGRGSSSTATSTSRRGSTRSAAWSRPTRRPRRPATGTARISAECYRPNAELGNLAPHLVGPRADAGRLAARTATRSPIAGFVDGDRGGQRARPAVPPHDPAAGVRSPTGGPRSAGGCATSSSGSGGRPTGMWLPETAVDLATLRLLAEAGRRAHDPRAVAGRRPAPRHAPAVPRRRWAAAGRSSSWRLRRATCRRRSRSSRARRPTPTASPASGIVPRLSRRAAARRRAPPLVVIATDGELYGHHQPFRDLFLRGSSTRPRRPGAASTSSRWPTRRASGWPGTRAGDPHRRAHVVELPSRRRCAGPGRAPCVARRRPGRRRCARRSSGSRPAIDADDRARSPPACPARPIRGRPATPTSTSSSGRTERGRVRRPLARGARPPAADRRFLALMEAQRWRLAMFAS